MRNTVKWTTDQAIEVLKDEIETILESIEDENEKSHWNDKNMTDLPVSTEYNRVVENCADYPIWACDDDGNCLVGESADEIEHISDIVEYYSNK